MRATLWIALLLLTIGLTACAPTAPETKGRTQEALRKEVAGLYKFDFDAPLYQEELKRATQEVEDLKKTDAKQAASKAQGLEFARILLDGSYVDLSPGGRFEFVAPFGYNLNLAAGLYEVQEVTSGEGESATTRLRVLLTPLGTSEEGKEGASIGFFFDPQARTVTGDGETFSPLVYRRASDSSLDEKPEPTEALKDLGVPPGVTIPEEEIERRRKLEEDTKKAAEAEKAKAPAKGP